MSSAESSAGSASSGKSVRTGFWQGLKGAIVRTENEFALLKGLAVVSLIGTMIGAYFQYLSNYQDKVSAQAKDDMAAATAAFTETSNTLSIAITLQELLFYDFAHAVELHASNDDGALTSKTRANCTNPTRMRSPGCTRAST
jgi:hypothetical protein